MLENILRPAQRLLDVGANVLLAHYLLKLSLIAIGVAVTVRIRRRLFGGGTTSLLAASGVRTLAIGSLFVWAGAIVAGRLMAYLK